VACIGDTDLSGLDGIKLKRLNSDQRRIIGHNLVQSGKKSVRRGVFQRLLGHHRRGTARLLVGDLPVEPIPHNAISHNWAMSARARAPVSWNTLSSCRAFFAFWSAFQVLVYCKYSASILPDRTGFKIQFIFCLATNWRTPVTKAWEV
jgi:hypothetical protein